MAALLDLLLVIRQARPTLLLVQLDYVTDCCMMMTKFLLQFLYGNTMNQVQVNDINSPRMVHLPPTHRLYPSFKLEIRCTLFILLMNLSKNRWRKFHCDPWQPFIVIELYFEHLSCFLSQQATYIELGNLRATRRPRQLLLTLVVFFQAT